MNEEYKRACNPSAPFGKDLISLFVRFVPRDLFEFLTKKISKITVRKIILSNIYYKALATAILMLVLTLVFFLFYIYLGDYIMVACNFAKPVVYHRLILLKKRSAERDQPFLARENISLI